VPFFFAIGFLWKKRIRLDAGNAVDAVLSGGLLAIAFGYVLICLLPGGVPRYLMPVYPLAALVTIELFSRVPESARFRYGKFAGKFNAFLTALLLMAPVVMIFLAGEQPDGTRVAFLLTSLVAVGTIAWWVPSRWRDLHTFVHTALLIAAGSIALLPGIQDFQGERDLFRKAAKEIDGLAPPGSRVVVYANDEFRNRFTRHLRLLYYVREPVTGIGETGSLPADTTLFIGLPAAEEEMREKLAGREVASESKIDVRRVSLLVLRLDPTS
jgi:hypothetical protein